VKIRTGGYSLAGVSELIIDSEKRLQSAFEQSPLRLWPDREAVEKWMLRAYLTAWRAHELDALTDSQFADMPARASGADAGRSGDTSSCPRVRREKSRHENAWSQKAALQCHRKRTAS
jgi:hypothetical protein